MPRWLSILIVLLLVACAPAVTPPPTSTLTPTLPAPTSTPMPTATPLPQLGSTRTDAFGIEQVWVPAGTFRMGTEPDVEIAAPDWAAPTLNSEKPAHEVEITRGFWLDRYEVTNTAYQAFVDAGGYEKQEYWSEAGWQWRQNEKRPLPIECQAAGPTNPRACVNWFEAEAYARWRGGQLPTEAQWEYAARGPESFIYPWGNEFDKDKTNLVGALGTKPVGSFPAGASWVGAHDMVGNVMEWVQDWWSTTYHQAQVRVDPPGPATGSRKIEKGGWWGAPLFTARAAYRHFEDPPGYQDHHIGFRIVTLQP